jgi:hypothetical protein
MRALYRKIILVSQGDFPIGREGMSSMPPGSVIKGIGFDSGGTAVILPIYALISQKEDR